MVKRLKIADAPYQTDSGCKRALVEQLPATNEELAALENKYGGNYHSQVGKFLHIQQVTQFTSGFPVTRIVRCAVAPNKAAFEGLKQEASFLATHLHTPIFHPRKTQRISNNAIQIQTWQLPRTRDY